MNYYEKIVILNPNIDDSAAEETIQRIRDVITKQGGEVFKTDNWGRRRLAYELNKHSKGNYVLLLFKAPPATILELEKLCKVIDTIIKFMVVRLVHKKQIEALTAVPVPEKDESAPAPAAEQQAPASEEAAAPAESDNV